MSRGFRLLALAALAPLAAGCSPTAAVAPTVARPVTTAQARDTAALEAEYWARIDRSRSGFTEADVDYMTGMIGHHAQALVMAAMAPTHGANPEVQRLAARIDNAQIGEILSMQKWLRDRDQPVPEVPEMAGHGDMAGMDHSGMNHGDMAGMDHGGMDHAMMPGMLTEAQLAALDAARGPAFDRLFLSGMIQHHSGAVTMVEALFATDGAAQDGEAFKLATDVQVDQRTEIARMQRMLDALP